MLPALLVASAMMLCFPFDSVGVNCQSPEALATTTPRTTSPSTIVTRLPGGRLTREDPPGILGCPRRRGSGPPTWSWNVGVGELTFPQLSTATAEKL